MYIQQKRRRIREEKKWTELDILWSICLTKSWLVVSNKEVEYEQQMEP